MSHDFIRDIQLDPVRERIFVVGADSYNVYVLRDVEGGVVEEPASAGRATASGLQVHQTPSGFELSYSIASPCRVDLSVYDQLGRDVRQLVDSVQSAGHHLLTWDCRDRNGDRVPFGAYFIQLRTPSAKEEQKVVVTRW